MQKIFWIILICLFVGLGTSACGAGTPKVKQYAVVQITGLYDEFNMNAKQIRALAPGTILIPAEGAPEVTCKVLDEIALCHVQVLETGETGWVESLLIIEKK